MRIDDFLYGLVPFESYPLSLDVERVNSETGRRLFGSRHLAESALQLISPMDTESDGRPRFAIVRWLDRKGNSMVRTFGPEEHAENRAQIHHVEDVVWRYDKADFIQVRVIKRAALMKIAMAL